MKKIILLVLMVALISAIILSGCVMVVKNNAAETPGASSTPYVTCQVSPGTSSPAVTTAAPPDTAFVHFTTKTLDGQDFDQTYFAQYKVTFINYWGTWCGPCVGELPDLEALYGKYKGAIGFIGICDDATDSASAQYATDVLGKSGVTYTNVMNFTQVADIYGAINAVPCSIIVDKDGKPLCDQIIGAVGLEEYAKDIDAALAAAK
jgi:thiol-disulfide isomerase/thioredoxin